MIALPQKLPHVIWKKDRLVPLSEGWLAESIEHSAAAAGHARWHLAPEVARAIAVYLENDWVAPSLSIDNLQEMVRRSLEGIGYADIAQKSLIVPPRVSFASVVSTTSYDHAPNALGVATRRRMSGPPNQRPSRKVGWMMTSTPARIAFTALTRTSSIAPSARSTACNP